MIGTTLTVLALAAAVFAIGWLSKVNRHLSELGKRVLESQDIGKIFDAANKTETFESRVASCEHKSAENQKQLAEYKTKLSELTANLGTVEQMAKKNEACFAELIPNIKALADEIQNIKKFQTATEKAHSLLLAAFTEMQSVLLPADGSGPKPEIAQPDPPEEWWQGKVDDPRMSESHN